MTNSKASQLARQDASVQAWLPNPKDWTDCFIRRTELGEADRAAYRQAFEAEFRAVLRLARRLAAHESSEMGRR